MAKGIDLVTKIANAARSASQRSEILGVLRCAADKDRGAAVLNGFAARQMSNECRHRCRGCLDSQHVGRDMFDVYTWMLIHNKSHSPCGMVDEPAGQPGEKDEEGTRTRHKTGASGQAIWPVQFSSGM
jgi:hypothetical protein